MGEHGRTFWDFATEHGWFRWLTAIAALVSVFLLAALGYRLKPDLFIFEREIAKAPAGVDSSTANGIYRARITATIKDGTTEDLALTERNLIRAAGFAKIERAGTYIISLHLILDYSSLPVANRNPYFKCGVETASSAGHLRRPLVSDRVFDISCAGTEVHRLNKGDVLYVLAGQASGSDLPVSGLLTVAALAE